MNKYVKLFEEFSTPTLLDQIKALPQFDELRKWGFEIEFDSREGREGFQLIEIKGHIPLYHVKFRMSPNSEQASIQRLKWNATDDYPELTVCTFRLSPFELLFRIVKGVHHTWEGDGIIVPYNIKNENQSLVYYEYSLTKFLAKMDFYVAPTLKKENIIITKRNTIEQVDSDRVDHHLGDSIKDLW